MKKLSATSKLAVIDALNKAISAISTTLETWTGGYDDDGNDLGVQINLSDAVDAIENIISEYTDD